MGDVIKLKTVVPNQTSRQQKPISQNKSVVSKRTSRSKSVDAINIGIEVERVRDLDGAGKREIVRLVRYDVIERLYRHRRGGKHTPLITLDQRDAANQLQADYELSVSVPSARTTLISAGSRLESDFNAAILDAARRVADARHACGVYWRAVEAVALRDQTVAAAALLMRVSAAAAKQALDRGLTALSRHYGMCV